MTAAAGLSNKVGGWKTQKLIVRSPQTDSSPHSGLRAAPRSDFPKQWSRETRGEEKNPNISKVEPVTTTTRTRQHRDMGIQ